MQHTLPIVAPPTIQETPGKGKENLMIQETSVNRTQPSISSSTDTRSEPHAAPTTPTPASPVSRALIATPEAKESPPWYKKLFGCGRKA